MLLCGKNVAIIRYKNGLSLRDLSLKSGIDVTTLNRVELGKSHPRPKTAKAICDALNASFDELFEIIDERKDI